MITCSQCGKPSARIKSFLQNGEMVDVCAQCLGIAESGGAKTKGILTRNSLRVRSESVKYEGDLQTSHMYDKMSRRMVPNPDFADRFTANSDQFYSEGEAKKAGLPKLAEHITESKRSKVEHKAKQRQKVQFEGDTMKGVTKQMKTLGINSSKKP